MASRDVHPATPTQLGRYQRNAGRYGFNSMISRDEDEDESDDEDESKDGDEGEDGVGSKVDSEHDQSDQMYVC